MNDRNGGIRRLQDEVARDPGAVAFVPLADLYRAQGRLEVARRVCLRGLARSPDLVEAHFLLGRIHQEANEPEQAADEWDITLRLDPGHVAARRALAFHLLHEGKVEEAGRHLRHAARNDPDDPRVRRALEFIERGRRPVGADARYWDAIATILSPVADDFLRESRARVALLMDSSGRLLLQRGMTAGFDLAGFASLAAGIHSASREAARMLGEPRFTQLYQGRADRQIFLGAIPTPAGEVLLLAVFGEETTVGLVRAVFRELDASLSVMNWPDSPPAVGTETLDAGLAAGLARVRAGVGVAG